MISLKGFMIDVKKKPEHLDLEKNQAGGVKKTHIVSDKILQALFMHKVSFSHSLKC